MRRFFFAVVFVLVTLTAMAGNPVAQGDSIQNLSNKFLERFNRFIKVRDTLFAKSVLSDWSEEIPNDPELYVAWFSYYYNASMKEDAIISKRPSQNPNDSNAEMKDSTGAVVGYLVTKRFFTPSGAANAIDAISKGVELYPSRLDMRILKIIMLGNVADWSRYADEIIALYKLNREKRYEWTLSGGAQYSGAEEYLSQVIEEWENTLFRMDVNGANMRRVAEAILESEPKSVSALNFMAISYLKEKEYSKALQWLKKADKYSPNNAMILQNLALSYKLLGDRKNYALYDAKAKSAQNQQ